MIKRMDKIIARTAAITAFLLFSVTAAPTFAATEPPAPTKTLVALGDSITFGYNLSDTSGNTVPSQDAFPFLIGQKEGLKVTDLGIPGWTSSDLVNAMHSANFLSAIHGASVITIDIGSNDLLRWAAENGILAAAKGTSVPTLTAAQQQQVSAIITQFGKNFAETIGLIRMVSHAPIVAYNLYDPFPTISPLHAITEPLQAIENNEITSIARLYKNVTVADAHAAFNNNQLVDVRVLEGDVHPTVEGQIALAQAGEKVLAPLIGKEPAPSVFSGITDLLAGEAAPSGGSMAGTVGNNLVKLTIPSGSLNQGTEVAITSQQPEQTNAMDLPFGLGTPVAETAINFMAGTKLAAPYTLTITNPAITKNSLVFAVSNAGFYFVGSAHISSGTVTVTGERDEDFIVLSLPSWL